ncbi:hypothetical protein M231_04107 [Tremella mesenterica]|uniref:ELYS-like domain-containing protein n=1 Tax=Tremella mesenterica TaxID=5217 RepID=A0A4Q1BLC8_TREME|nr:hypothetical protein M231_04107 [Tremella mesenterica]
MDELPHSILRHFDISFSPYTSEVVQAITLRRGRYPEGKLFLDRLLELANVDGQTLYPPTSPAGLRRLLHAIHSSPVDRLKRDCFFYYLLKDFPSTGIPNGHKVSQDDANGDSSSGDVSNDGMVTDDPHYLSDVVEYHTGMGEVGKEEGEEDKAEEFARRKGLPRVWRVFMDGYWNLDHERWEDAVHHLSDPAITSLNFTSTILQALSTLPPSALSLSLIHKFLTSVHPPLITIEENLLRLFSLAHVSSLSTALNQLRILPLDKSRLFSSLLCWLFGIPDISCGSDTPTVQTRLLKELIHLPLLEEEQSHLIEFLHHPPKRMSRDTKESLADLVTLRLVHTGQYSESLQLDKDLAGGIGNEEERYRRREMVREFIGILPEAQKRVLMLDSYSYSYPSNTSLSTIPSTTPVSILSNKQFDTTINPGDVKQNGHRLVEPQISTTTLNGHGETDVEMSMSDTWISIPHPNSTLMKDDQPETSKSIKDLQISGLSDRPNSSSIGLGISKTISLQSRNRAASPFSGPPKFATSGSNSPIKTRVASGSPFTLPKSIQDDTTPTKKIPKTRKIINDDLPSEHVNTTSGHIPNQPFTHTLPTPKIMTTKHVEPMTNLPPRSSSIQHAPSKIIEDQEEKNHFKEVGDSSKQQRRSTRSSKPKSHHEPILQETDIETIQSKRVQHEEEDDDTVFMPGSFSPPSPPSKTRRVTRATSEIPNTRNSRATRSMSRALEDEEPNCPSKRQRGKHKARASIASMETVLETPAVRRSTRRATTQDPSERGSPPPVVGTIPRARRGRGGTATPRARRKA